MRCPRCGGLLRFYAIGLYRAALECRRCGWTTAAHAAQAVREVRKGVK